LVHPYDKRFPGCHLGAGAVEVVDQERHCGNEDEISESRNPQSENGGAIENLEALKRFV
jgi:hypothetical protein